MSQVEGTETASQPQQPGTDVKRPKWTIMIYLAGDNNLSANSLSVLQQLEAAKIHPGCDVRVLACFDANTPRPRGARYLEIKHRRFVSYPKPSMNWGLHNDLVQFDALEKALEIKAVQTPSFCDTLTVPNPVEVPDVQEGLSRFLKFALENHQADRYMLILYGHGTVVAGNTFLADNNPPSFLRLRDFAEVLKKYFDVRDNTVQLADVMKAQAEGTPPPQEQLAKERKPALDILACDNCIMNGIEAAYQVKGQVKYALGSQGLALAVGWPFRKIINAVINHRNDRTEQIAERLLRVCARNLIDFTLMDRSSEQSLCDLTTLHYQPNLVSAVRGLSQAMQKGLRVKPREWKVPEDEEEADDKKEAAGKQVGEVIYPVIRDAIRLARLEAQSYWDERFVDLYDFCELLLVKCNEHLHQFYGYGDYFLSKFQAAVPKTASDKDLRDSIAVLRRFWRIAEWCKAILKEIKTKKFVLKSYYIGPALQYSNGVSIFFPWTLPERPVIFEPADKKGNCASAGSYGISWTGFGKFPDEIPKKYKVKTAFEEYQTYAFAKEGGGDWANFLVKFFKATLRDVRRFDYKYVKPEKPEESRVFFEKRTRFEPLIPSDRVDLQKTDSDNESEKDCDCPEIKNYPHRFYISPADCERLCKPHSVPENEKVGDAKENGKDGKGYKNKKPCVSYLGWNIRGLVAEVINLHDDSKPGADGAEDFVEAAESEAEESDFDETDSEELADEALDDDEPEE